MQAMSNQRKQFLDLESRSSKLLSKEALPPMNMKHMMGFEAMIAKVDSGQMAVISVKQSHHAEFLCTP